jgi:hypothetical protein
VYRKWALPKLGRCAACRLVGEERGCVGCDCHEDETYKAGWQWVGPMRLLQVVQVYKLMVGTAGFEPTTSTV